MVERTLITADFRKNEISPKVGLKEKLIEISSPKFKRHFKAVLLAVAVSFQMNPVKKAKKSKSYIHGNKPDSGENFRSAVIR